MKTLRVAEGREQRAERRGQRAEGGGRSAESKERRAKTEKLSTGSEKHKATPTTDSPKALCAPPSALRASGASQ
jgi:hypothetical protein